MPKKKRKQKEIKEQAELLPVETEARDVETALGEFEAVDPVVSPHSYDLSADDLLDEVRHSLMEDETQKEEAQKAKWWKRIGGRGAKKNVDDDATGLDPEVEPTEIHVENMDPDAQNEYEEQIDELIDLLETEMESKDSSVETEVEVHQQNERVAVDFDDLKKRVFGMRTSEDAKGNLSEVRSIALADEEVFVEVETRPVDPIEERWKAVENAILPYRRYISFAVLFIGVVSLFVVSFMLYGVYRQSLPQPVVTETVVLPYPVVMNLPGGLKFSLGKGALLQDGRWEPRGPEWLEGTEICRWVALPYSRQLEAVIRTLTRKDEIELIMSNNDRLVYNVYSITRLSIDDMQKLDSDSPCLLLVLAQADTDERWVVTAIP